MPDLETFTGFNADKMGQYFADQGYSVEMTPVSELVVVNVTPGAALECGDGRFDKLIRRKAHGIRIFGGINALQALLTGGNRVGLERATELIHRFGAKPGTHSADEGGCGYADLWIAGKLESAIYPYDPESMEKGDLRLRARLEERMKDLGGKHFRLNGNHNEEGLRINPVRGMTEDANDGLRFRVDDWFMADLGIPDHVRFFKIAETVKK